MASHVTIQPFLQRRTHTKPGVLPVLILLSLMSAGLAYAPAPAAAQESTTFFIAAQGEGLERAGDWWMQSFTVYRPTRFVFRFTSDLSAQAAIIGADQAGAFQDFDSFTGYGLFDNQFGTKIVDLPAGDYYVAVRNLDDNFNNFTLELDYPLNLANSLTTSYAFSDSSVQGSSYVEADGGYLYHRFTVQAGYRYFLDGCNSGLDTYIIPDADLNAFIDGGNFRYYQIYSGTTTNLPGFYEVKLPPGNYDIVFENLDAVAKATTYTLERWRAISSNYASTGLKLYTPASWQIVSDKAVRLSVARVANNSRTRTSGALKLELWALTTPYNGGSTFGTKMAEYRLPGVLKPGFNYQNIVQNLPLNPPAPGRRYTALFLTELTNSQWAVRDYLNFQGPTSFSLATAPQTRSSITGKAGASAKSGPVKSGEAKSGETHSGTSAVRFSTGTASAASGSITLHFSAPLDAESASDAGHYSVAVNGRSVAIESAAYNARTNSVVLSLTPGALRTGNAVVVHWTGVQDAAGKTTSGSTRLTAQ